MERIIIERCDHGFNVIQGDRYSDGTTYEEALGLVAYLLAKAYPDMPLRFENWMRTEEEWTKWRDCLHGGVIETDKGEQ